MSSASSTFVAIAALSLCIACGDDGAPLERPETYEFPSRFIEDASAIHYDGQVFRQTLIAALKTEIGSWTDLIDNQQILREEAVWLAALNFYFRFDSASSLDADIGIDLGVPTVQITWGDISGGANLIDKTAGQDGTTDHRDFDGGGFAGWSAGSPGSPVALVDQWFSILASQAAARSTDIPDDPFGDDIEHVYITPSGQDLRQLLQKFLLGAITFSQGTDDYLDSGTDGKGLEASNTQNEQDPYSTLGHQWDEGFGYFGARRDYDEYSDADNAADGFSDTDGDGLIDLRFELNTGMALNAAKRDLASAVTTDFSSTIFEAQIAGRHIIWASAGNELSGDEKAALQAHRDVVVEHWERVFAATSIHYINETIAEMAEAGTADYSFAEHAKVWSELKGFSLAFQFNPRSRLSDGDFESFHELLGDAPVVSADGSLLDAYEADLLAARDILATAYAFDPANVEAW